MLFLTTPALRLEDAIPTGDATALARLHKWGGMRLVHNLVQLFEDLTPDRMQTVRKAVASGDAATAEAAAHTLGSSAGQLGAARLQRLCRTVEALAGRGELESAVPLVSELEAEYGRYVEWLAREAAPEEGTVVLEQVA